MFPDGSADSEKLSATAVVGVARAQSIALQTPFSRAKEEIPQRHGSWPSDDFQAAWLPGTAWDIASARSGYLCWLTADSGDENDSPMAVRQAKARHP